MSHLSRHGTLDMIRQGGEFLNPPNCTNIHCSNQLTDFEVGKQIIKRNKYIFCKQCRTGWSRGRILFWKCANCGGVLSSTFNLLNKKYCDLDCRYESRRKIMFKKEKKCLMCGQVFLTSWGKYCSQKCVNRYQKMKRKDVRLCLIPSS